MTSSKTSISVSAGDVISVSADNACGNWLLAWAVVIALHVGFAFAMVSR